ncbi:hypothetical protein [Streptomyces sioyaensis]|uniref:hypothetical protein n=1 Tax=Streptomyces sioyaensis TaxID=67364 RepID=UPI0037A7585E
MPRLLAGCTADRVASVTDQPGFGVFDGLAGWRSFTEHKMIPWPVQRAMAVRVRADATTVEAAGGQSIFVSKPTAIADLIKQAASATMAVPT